MMKTNTTLLIYLLILSTSCFIPSSTLAQCNRVQDSLALVALYNATDGANWTTTWDLNQPIDDWFGIDLNEDGCVYCVDLDGYHECSNGGNPNGSPVQGNNLVGELPVQFFSLSQVQRIFLKKNSLNSELVPEFNNLINLEVIDLSDNELHGSIPDLGNLIELKSISLRRNNISGSIPESIGLCANLLTLDLALNNLNNEIPSELGNLSLLSNLLLNNNDSLQGQIPETFSNLSNLKILNLYDNQLHGEIPLYLGNLKELTTLNLGANLFSGPIPDTLTTLTKLSQTLLDRCQFSGSIPEGFGSLVNLTKFKLSDNMLSGCIPSDFEQICNIGFAETFIADGYDFTNNPCLPWLGNFQPFCSGEEQIGAPVDDGDPSTTNDVLGPNCECSQIMSCEETQTPEFYFSDIFAEVGDTISIDIRVVNFVDVTSFAFSIAFDTMNFNYVSGFNDLNVLPSSISYSENFVDEGILQTIFVDNETTLIDSTTIFSFYLVVVNNNPSSSPVQLTSFGNLILEITYGDFCSTTEEILLGNITVLQDEEICNNGIDDDGDNLIDCADPDVQFLVCCIDDSCENGINNDQDSVDDGCDRDDDNDGILDIFEGFCYEQPKFLGSERFTAKGSGENGIPDVTLNIPNTTEASPFIVVSVMFERDHTIGESLGDNWPTNFDENESPIHPNLAFGDVNLSDFGWAYYFQSQDVPAQENTSYLSTSTFHYFAFFTPQSNPVQPLDISQLNLPKNEGDEMIVMVSYFEGVRRIEFVDIIFALDGSDLTFEFNPESEDPEPGADPANNLLLGINTFSGNGQLSSNTDTINLANIYNESGTYLDDGPNQNLGSENDGLSAITTMTSGQSNIITLTASLDNPEYKFGLATYLRLIGCQVRDTDNDGIADYQDLDSDNDGCPDAIEGGLSLTFEDLNSDLSLAGDTNEDGVPNIAGGGQVPSISIDSSLISELCLPEEICDNGIDDDGDGDIDCDDADLADDCCCFEPEFSLFGTTYFCPDGVTSILAIGQYESILWSTGDTGSTLITGEAGEYNIQVDLGCDYLDTITFNITELDTDTFFIMESICEGDSVLVNDEVYTQAGSFEQSIRNSDTGCDDIYAITITYEEPISSMLSLSICTGESAEVNDLVYNSAGTYTQTFTSTDGCDSLLLIDIVVIPTIDTVVYYQLIEGQSIIIDGDLYSETTEFTVTYTSELGCDSIVNHIILESLPILFYDFDECIITGSNFDEFTPEYPYALSCASLSTTSLYRNNPVSNGHSCTTGTAETQAMCISSLSVCTPIFESGKNLILETTISPDLGTVVDLQSFNFLQLAPEYFAFTSGSSGINDYPTLYAVRVSLNGESILELIDIPTQQVWTQESIDLSSITITTESILTIELLPYCTAGIDAITSAWDLENIELYATCRQAQLVINASGKITDRNSDELTNVNLEVTTSDGIVYFNTNHGGLYDISLVDHAMASIKPILNTGTRNGISTLDLIIIQRHILNIKPLSSHYDYIAADVNNSKSITAADIGELRKVILGYQEEFANNTSWRFDLDHEQSSTQGNYNINEVGHLEAFINSTLDFTAIKIGDVNNSALAQYTGSEVDIRELENVNLKCSIHENTIDFYLSQSLSLSGLQLSFVIRDNTIKAITSETLEINPSNYHVDPDGNAMISWNTDQSIDILSTSPIFSLTLNTNANIEDVSVSEALTNEVYDNSLNVYGVNILNSESANSFTENEEILLSPLPFDSRLTIQLINPCHKESIELEVYSLNGELLHQSTRHDSDNRSGIFVEDLSHLVKGIYLLKAQTECTTSIQRIVKM